MKKKILIVLILAIIVAFILIGNFWILKTKKVTILTDKREYQIGEKLKIKIENNLFKNICFSSCYPYFLEKKKEKWESYPYQECKKANLVENCIGAGKIKAFEIEVPLMIEEKIFHRIALPVCFDCKIGEKFKEEKRFYSNEFLVKEKEILKEVTITTDKREYEQGEEVKITVENISNKEIKISLPYYIYGIEKLMAGEWKNLATNKCDCPEIECKVSPSYFLLPAGEKFELKWDQKEIKCDTLEFIQVSVGKYRAYTIVVEKERAKRIYSNEFTIKEKPEVTILTDKKEYEQGEVVRITMQNNTNKIVEFLSGKDDKKYQYECGYGCWGFIEIFKNGTWHKIDALPRCPCGAKCRVATPYPILSSNESFTIYWNQLIVDCSSIKDYKTRKASFGQYRITAKVKLNDGAPQTIYSNEFTIK